MPQEVNNETPDYIRRLNDVAELVEIATNYSAADGSVGNAYGEILHALAVEIPVMFADALDRAQRKIADWESTFRAAEAAAQQWDLEWECLATILGLSPEDETEPPGLVALVGAALDRAQRERDALSQSHDELFAERTALRDALFMFASVLQASGRWSPKLANAMADATKPLHAQGKTNG